MVSATSDGRLASGDTYPEPLEDRLWRQVAHGLDVERLLPTEHQRRKALAKKLDRPLDVNGWRIFVAGCAHSIRHGKAKQKKGAEATLVRMVGQWAADVADLLPDRMEDLRRIVTLLAWGVERAGKALRRHRSADVRYPTVLTQGRNGFGREAHTLPPLIGRRAGGAVQYSLLPGLGPEYDEYGGEFLASVLPVELYTTRGKGAPLDIRMGLEAIFDALGRGRSGGRLDPVPWRHLLGRIYPGRKVSRLARARWPGLNRALDLLEKDDRWRLPVANGRGGWEGWRVVSPYLRPLTGHPSERVGFTVTLPDTVNPRHGSIHDRPVIAAAGAVSTQRLALTTALPVLWDRPGDLRREVRGEWRQVANPAAYPLLSSRGVVSLMYPGGVPKRKRWRELEDEARTLLDWLASEGYATCTREPGGRRIMPGARWPGWAEAQRKLIEPPVHGFEPPVAAA